MHGKTSRCMFCLTVHESSCKDECMEKMTSSDLFAIKFAEEVFSEMARKRYTAKDLAEIISRTPHTAGNRLNGKVPFDAVEMGLVADWLNMDLAVLVARAELYSSKAVA